MSDAQTADRQATLNGLAALQRDLDEARFVGSAQDGTVTATVRAPSTVLSVTINPELKDRATAEELSGYVVEAIHRAAAQAEQMLRTRMRSLGVRM